ncbi:MAG: hypothetical protein AVDCRST_MAG36-3086 [uncultured Nocardioidaceae bacterium]|uniref:Uncharacterized protein n=1 Tax=uncultured Nocardioidaceae bacterium TaxID=253824 RepID=A0A6J4MQW4_9ACTN|nr:MAG: hypothetical protein AVDCRST_MAG36-3086 [uncultured Nocardioidaceae bacterium]
MELTRFHKVRSGVQANARPGDAGDLAAARSHVRSGLVLSGFFHNVEVDATDEVDNLVVAMCSFPEQLSADRVAQRLTRLWQDRLRYPFWEAHTTLVDTDQVELEGATRGSAHGHYLTVHIIAQRGAPESLDGTVPTLPGQRGA